MRYLSFLIFVFLTHYAMGQNIIKGTILDDNGLPLPGANISVKGTTVGTTTDFDGEFSISTDRESGVLIISYIGFRNRELSFDSSSGSLVDLGEIQLETDDHSLGEVVLIGKGIIDLTEDRETPIAVSTISKREIQLSGVGNVEFPESMKNTPNVYVGNQSGGFGDSEMYMRGFDQSNTAFLVNGQPVNDMSNGRIYWSNWSGLSDIVNVVQIQRGLGSSKLAISSVGGTVNMVTKATERREGGFARFLIGNDSYMKGTISYDTGVSENGWGFSFLLDYWQADRKYAYGTRGKGQVYFFSVGKKAGNHNFNLMLTGAPQQHAQNFTKTQEEYDYFGRKYNSNYGFRDGKFLSERVNYYHKPILNFNWDWDIEEDLSLSTVLYASVGRGGGTGSAGDGIGFLEGYERRPDDPDFLRGAYRSDNGLIDWDFVEMKNREIEGGIGRQKYIPGEGTIREGTILTSNVNNHVWYGAVSNFEYDKIENLSLNIGADLRFYRGYHFQQVVDLLGLEGFNFPTFGDDNHVVTQTYRADPWSSLFNYAPTDQRQNWNDYEDVNYQGVFGQAEWANEAFSVFVQGSFSNQSYRGVDRGHFAETRKSKKIYKTGYNIKGGASWKFIEDHSIFVNAGKYSRQPFNNSIFNDNNDKTHISDNVDNEEILGLEAGYRFEAPDFRVHLNAYYTKWKNRFLSRSGGTYHVNGEEYQSTTFQFTNIAQLHKGLELDAQWDPIPDLSLRGYATVGNWEYNGRSPVRVRDNDSNRFVDELEVNLKKTKVGQAPQTSAGLGLTYHILPMKLRTHINWNHYGKFYGYVDPQKAADEALEGNIYQPEKLNSYSLVDWGASYTLHFEGGHNRLQFTGNIYNLMNHQYVSQQRNEVEFFYGTGRTYNLAVKYYF